MAAAQAAAAFPPPPPYYKLYSGYREEEDEEEEGEEEEEEEEETASAEQGKESGKGDDEDEQEEDDEDEDEDESLPPPPPIEGTYEMFGQIYTTEDLLPDLEEQGVKQLYPKDKPVDFRGELHRLNRSLLFSFVDLIKVLAEHPSQYARRIEDIGVILRNMHHLLNSLRPHQARATLVHMLQMQIQQRRVAVQDVRRQTQEAMDIVQSALESLESGREPDSAGPSSMTM